MVAVEPHLRLCNPQAHRRHLPLCLRRLMRLACHRAVTPDRLLCPCVWQQQLRALGSVVARLPHRWSANSAYPPMARLQLRQRWQHQLPRPLPVLGRHHLPNQEHLVSTFFSLFKSFSSDLPADLPDLFRFALFLSAQLPRQRRVALRVSTLSCPPPHLITPSLTPLFLQGLV
jgi:hypothetical protein